MPDAEPQPLKQLVEGGLERSGLSQRAMTAVRRVGDFVQKHPGLPLAVGALGYAGEVAVNQALHPEWGIGANIFSPIFFDVSPVDGQLALNSLQGLFQGMFVGGGATGVISGLAEKAREIIYLPDIKRGRARNPYKQMLLMVDHTNEAREGSTHGDFYNELYRYLLLQRPDLLTSLVQKYGPVCEIVPENTPEPAAEPIPLYFRSPNPSNTEFLRDLVKADRAEGTISVLMSRSHTVWDAAVVPTQESIDTLNNMNSTITSTLEAGDIPRIIITNNRDITSHGAYDPHTGSTRIDSIKAEKYFTDKGYHVVLAEHEVMAHLTTTFTNKLFRKVVLMNDGTPEGERIAANWLDDYNSLKAGDKTSQLPEIIEVPEGRLGEVLKTQEYDGIFLLGADDIRVAEAAQAILNRQRDGGDNIDGYRQVPLEILMESRGSADSLAQIEERGGGLHFVHEVLAEKAVDILLEPTAKDKPAS